MASSIYQLKITLKQSAPPIWRRILISGDATFRDLHEAIQISMGWYDGHLHQFFTEKQHGLYMGGCITNTSIEDIEPFEEAADEREVRLQDRLSAKGSRCSYEYDFGDSWEHEILVEKIIKPEPGMEYPVCIGGRRQCPPEDCGGLGGYDRLLEILTNPRHKEHAEMLEWLGLENQEEFDPEALDIDEVNATLREPYETLVRR
ncbi:MAG: plasmid pRiA4b ORF-3 family protein [Candidatus Peregrinibacteria bacterium]